MPCVALSVPESAAPPAEAARDDPALPRNAQLILQTLRQCDKPVKAYGLLELLRERGITAPMTVYRALDRLMAEGLVRKIGALNAFVALPAPLEEPVAFIICRQCGKTRMAPLHPAVQGWLYTHKIAAIDAHLEAFSDCADWSESHAPIPFPETPQRRA